MTIAADKVTGDLRIKFDRKPDSRDEIELMNQMKDTYGFSWKGYGDTAKWHGPKTSVIAFEDRTFLARIKLTCKAISFFAPTKWRGRRPDVDVPWCQLRVSTVNVRNPD